MARRANTAVAIIQWRIVVVTNCIQWRSQCDNGDIGGVYYYWETDSILLILMKWLDAIDPIILMTDDQYDGIDEIPSIVL